jgi:hypothetical protein
VQGRGHTKTDCNEEAIRSQKRPGRHTKRLDVMTKKKAKKEDALVAMESLDNEDDWEDDYGTF